RHELIESRTREGRPHQYEERDEEERLEEKPDHSRENGTQPAAKEEHGDHGGDQRDSHVLADEEHAEFHARVFGVVSRDQFALGFGQVEWDAARFGESRDQKQDEDGEQRNDEPELALGWHEGAGAEGPG